jgi:hypothetical protein
VYEFLHSEIILEKIFIGIIKKFCHRFFKNGVLITPNSMGGCV